MRKGFIFLHRELLDWEWYQAPNVSRLFIHLILRANYSDKPWQGREVKRGQLVTSLQHLAAELGLSVQKIRTALDKLVQSGYVEKRSTNAFTLLTVSNYDKYQSVDVADFSEGSKPANSPLMRHKQTDSNRITTTKEENKSNKKTKEERKRRFKNEVFAHSTYDSKILNGFYDYWSEYDQVHDKMRYETHRFFEVGKRLKKWDANERKRSEFIVEPKKPKVSVNR